MNHSEPRWRKIRLDREISRSCDPFDLDLDNCCDQFDRLDQEKLIDRSFDLDHFHRSRKLCKT